MKKISDIGKIFILYNTTLATSTICFHTTSLPIYSWRQTKSLCNSFAFWNKNQTANSDVSIRYRAGGRSENLGEGQVLGVLFLTEEA